MGMLTRRLCTLTWDESTPDRQFVPMLEHLHLSSKSGGGFKRNDIILLLQSRAHTLKDVFLPECEALAEIIHALSIPSVQFL